MARSIPNTVPTLSLGSLEALRSVTNNDINRKLSLFHLDEGPQGDGFNSRTSSCTQPPTLNPFHLKMYLSVVLASLKLSHFLQNHNESQPHISLFKYSSLSKIGSDDINNLDSLE